MTEDQNIDNNVGAPGSGEDDIKEQLSVLSQQGYQLLKEFLLDEAREKFEEILQVDPENNYALVGIGDLERRRKRYTEAIEFYEACLRSSPNNNYALFGLAETYRKIGQYNRAISYWERYLEYDDKNVAVLTRAADAYRKARKFERSKEIYLRTLDLECDNAYALIGLGHLHYDFREFNVAREYWERMYNQSGATVDIRVLTSLGNCHRRLKTYQQGIMYFEKALALDPNNFYGLYGIADCYRGLHQSEQALPYWFRLFEIDPENKAILTRSADAYRSMGEYEKAEEYYRKALNVAFDSYAVLGLAIIHLIKNRYDDAIATLEDLVNNDPSNVRATLKLSSCYEEQHRVSEALAILVRHARAVEHPSRAVQRRIDELS